MVKPALGLLGKESSSPTHEELREQERRIRVRLLFVVLAVAVSFALTAGAVYVVHWGTPDVYFLVLGALLFPALALRLRRTRSPELPAHVVTVYLLIVIVSGMFTGGVAELGLVYAFPLPVMVFLIHRRSIGLAYVSGFIVLYGLVVTGEAAGLVRTAFMTRELLVNFVVLLVVTGLTAFYQTAWERSQDAVQRHLFSDMLTDLPNRRQLLDDLGTTVAPVVFLINADYFNEINDAFGPRIGDQVLVELAKRMGELVPADSFRLYKLHADEFALVVEQRGPRMSDGEMTSAAERISRGIAAHSFLGAEYALRVSVTIGIANAIVVGREKVLPRADIALKTAKAQHKPWMLFKHATQVETQFRRNVEQLAVLTNAIQQGRIVAHYQPIFDPSSRRLEKYECLARLIGEDGSVHGPGEFLDLAKKARLYEHITRSVFDCAFDTFRNREAQFTINLSVLDILSPDTRAYIRERLIAEPDTASRLVLELLESEQIETFGEVRDFVSSTRELGVRFAIDDFGSGYSNFAYIASLQFDFLKIDGSLVRNICSSEQAVDIVTTIVDFSKKLGIRTIAEFVSDEQTYERVRQLGVDFCQGYYLGRPIAAPVGTGGT
jgi:diguanylate cyclase (GGDEF)-like protein